ncbi:MAG: hypothetical protein AAFR42_19590, partial [Cyanobacteria bacterium J06628_6]
SLGLILLRLRYPSVTLSNDNLGALVLCLVIGQILVMQALTLTAAIPVDLWQLTVCYFVLTPLGVFLTASAIRRLSA